jgi:hypothetical protein
MPQTYNRRSARVEQVRQLPDRKTAIRPLIYRLMPMQLDSSIGFQPVYEGSIAPPDLPSAQEYKQDAYATLRNEQHRYVRKTVY